MTDNEFREVIKKEAANMLYLYIPDNVITRRNFGRYVNIIADKKRKQYQFLNGNCVVRNIDISEFIGDLDSNGNLVSGTGLIPQTIAATYAPLPHPNTGVSQAATPSSIIYQLAQGNEVNGINWSEGIFGLGIGEVADNFGNFVLGKGNTGDVTFDSATGMVKKNGKVVGDIPVPIYNKRGNTTYSFTDKESGITYTTQYNKRKKVWTALSASDGTNTINPSGEAITQMDGEMWTNILNMSMVIMEQLADFASNFAASLTGVTSNEALSPIQVADGWYEPESNSGVTTAALLGGGLLLGGLVVSNKKKKR